ncbi:RNA-binding domain-containing protein [Clostridium psychrophilum]|uniref:RNA-binding domain-containing protein n=1 Tax=Clostridium psychrophilum TaxID=132926 RepID=UPI001C0AF0FE|nr:RNA-binding domain-containing protein [Clostridium psychrophilum]MBU3181177.1 putative DNA binding domain-containing protein [Clostridium psychrophilum]
MSIDELEKLLDEYRSLPLETEWLEFKEAKNTYDFNKLGKYFSALSNEANLKGKRFGWMVFGVEDKNRKIVGTNYRANRASLDSLKHEISMKTTNNITFIEIHELMLTEGRVIMFQIPAAPQGIPIAWEGHFYGRDSESIGPLNLQEIEEIRQQRTREDWSAQICDEATIKDLDSQAILKARLEYKNKNPKLAEDSDKWDDRTFLDKAKVTIKGKITRTAIILLGKEESEHFIGPSVSKITWVLKDDNNIEKDYEHFGPPFLINVDKVFEKIRNLKYRYLTENTLFPTEITQYDPYVIREVLHNCIAHQDYTLMGRINLVEKSEKLIFTNCGSFIPQTIEKVIDQDAPQEYYRNQFLANAMVSLNMIDTIGSGIKKMFIKQMQRYFPLPDYDLKNPERVKVGIMGKIIDENYTKLLLKNTYFDLKTVIALDKVQKKEPLTVAERKFLKNQKLIEGRNPNIYVVSQVAAATGDKVSYIKNRAFNNEYYKKLIIDFITEFKQASRKEIDKLLLDKLPDILDEKQKHKKISNILTKMANRDRSIINCGPRTKPNWMLRNNLLDTN